MGFNLVEVEEGLGLAVPERFVLPHLLFAAVAAGVVAMAAQHPPQLLACGPMRRLGDVSYSLYLVHFAVLSPCLAAAEWLMPGDGIPTLVLHFGLTGICSFGLACAGYRWIEQPCIRRAARLLRDRLAAMMATKLETRDGTLR